MMNGVEYSHSAGNKLHLFVVADLSDEFKDLIRKRFVSVCQGFAYYEKWEELSSYAALIKDFLERYEGKAEEKKMGLIGELLAHILIFQYLPDLKSVTPFFNMEDRGPKKGFDLVLYSETTNAIWHVEVKSGNANSETPANANRVLLNRAKADLSSKLNDSNRNHWTNAINGARLACHNNRKISDIVGKILSTGLREATEGISHSSSKNAALVSVLYKHVNEKVTLPDVEPIHTRIAGTGSFNDLIVLSIQKSTYDKVYRFLKAEAGQ